MYYLHGDVFKTTTYILICVAWWVKYLLCNLEDLGLIPRTCIIKLNEISTCS